MLTLETALRLAGIPAVLLSVFYWAVVIPGAIGVTQMIVTRTFIQSTIPDDLLEAAQIDGCNDIRFFFQFVLPLSKAVIAVIAMQYAIGHWNAYFNAFLYLTNSKLFTGKFICI